LSLHCALMARHGKYIRWWLRTGLRDISAEIQIALTKTAQQFDVTRLLKLIDKVHDQNHTLVELLERQTRNLGMIILSHCSIKRRWRRRRPNFPRPCESAPHTATPQLWPDF
jgi:hypothetical protein